MTSSRRAICVPQRPGRTLRSSRRSATSCSSGRPRPDGSAGRARRTWRPAQGRDRRRRAGACCASMSPTLAQRAPDGRPRGGRSAAGRHGRRIVRRARAGPSARDRPRQVAQCRFRRHSDSCPGHRGCMARVKAALRWGLQRAGVPAEGKLHPAEQGASGGAPWGGSPDPAEVGPRGERGPIARIDAHAVAGLPEAISPARHRPHDRRGAPTHEFEHDDGKGFGRREGGWTLARAGTGGRRRERPGLSAAGHGDLARLSVRHTPGGANPLAPWGPAPAVCGRHPRTDASGFCHARPSRSIDRSAQVAQPEDRPGLLIERADPACRTGPRGPVPVGAGTTCSSPHPSRAASLAVTRSSRMAPAESAGHARSRLRQSSPARHASGSANHRLRQ